jgi:hypothetical protein
VTTETTPADIGDILLGVMLLRLGLVMALIAINVGVGAVMAARALPASITVIHGETVAADVHIVPIVGVVALRTLTGPVIGRRIMAGLAVGLPAVIEAGVAPRAGVVALRTLSAVMPAGPVMAGLAIGLPTVVEAGIAPVAGVVAV